MPIKYLGKNGLHERRSNSDESPTGRSQSRSDLHSRKNTNNGPPHGRTGSLDELPVFSVYKADIGCCNFVEHEIELEEGAVPHRKGARRIIPQKSEACRAEIEILLEYDMIEPSKLPWACGVVTPKKKGGSLAFVANFAT